MQKLKRLSHFYIMATMMWLETRPDPVILTVNQDYRFYESISQVNREGYFYTDLGSSSHIISLFLLKKFQL